MYTSHNAVTKYECVLLLRYNIDAMVKLKIIVFTFHGPVIDRGFCYQGDGVEVDPLPEGDVLHHLMGLHLALHLYVEDL